MDSDTSRGSGTRGNKAARGTSVEECQRPGAAGQPPWRALARQAARRGTRVAGLPAAAYGGHKDASAAWAAGVLAVGAGPAVDAAGAEECAVPEALRAAWAARVAIMVAAGGRPRAEAERLARGCLQPSGEER